MDREAETSGRRPRPRRQPIAAGVCAGLVAILVAGACTAGPASQGERGLPARAIPQPGVPADLPVAPESQRVDLAMPSFSDPTDVTNPLHPTGVVGSVVMLGHVDGKPFRTEVTLLPETRIIEWGGQRVETLVSQYVAFLDGQIHEVAYDFYAQDDVGAVWYFGEDVFNFQDGSISDTHGTWIAGKDGPAAMIMPAEPHVGDAYRPENIPGLVFEEVRVRTIGRRLHGPVGPIDGGLTVQELHMDGKWEDKVFAPGYGEFLTAGGGDVEAMALAVPTDALSGPVPPELHTLAASALELFDVAGAGDWKAATSSLQDVVAAWQRYRTEDAPTMIRPRMDRAVRRLSRAVDARGGAQAQQAAIDVARWTFDLQILHRPVEEVDLARFDLWAAQLVVDAQAGDAAAANGDLFSLDYVRDRILDPLGPEREARINALLEELHGAVGEERLEAAARAATRVRAALQGLAAP